HLLDWHIGCEVSAGYAERRGHVLHEMRIRKSVPDRSAGRMNVLSEKFIWRASAGIRPGARGCASRRQRVARWSHVTQVRGRGDAGKRGRPGCSIALAIIDGRRRDGARVRAGQRRARTTRSLPHLPGRRWDYVLAAPGLGKRSIRKQPAPANPKATLLNWAPMTGGVSSSGDLGFTTGPFVFEDRSGAPRPPRH